MAKQRIVKKKTRNKPLIPTPGTIPLNEHGYRKNSDSARIVEIMVKGGLDRQDINEKIVDAINPLTRSGNYKNIPSLVSGLLTKCEEKGYRIEAKWRLIPPE